MDQRQRGGEWTKIKVHPAADDVGDHFGAAAIGHVGGLDAGGEANFSALICTALPMPTEPNEIDPGLALASAMKSCTVFHGREAGTIITWRWSQSSRPTRGPWWLRM